MLGRESFWAVEDEWYRPFAAFVTTYRDPQFVAGLAENAGPVTSVKTSRWSLTPFIDSPSNRFARTPNTCTGPTPIFPSR